jgi:hypothetical protein
VVVASDDGCGHELGAQRVVDIVRRLGRHDGDGVVLERVAQVNAQRLPGALGLVLGDAVAELARVPQGGPVHHARLCATDIPYDQPERAADGRVGHEPGPESPRPAVHARSGRDRAVEDQGWVVVCNPYRDRARQGARPEEMHQKDPQRRTTSIDD